MTLPKENIYGHRKKLDFILETIKDYSKINSKTPSGLKILDVGCGNATAVTFPIASLGFTVVGVDMHESSIEYAKSNNTFPNLSFQCKKVEDLSTKEKFDIIICADIIEHLENPLLMLNHLHLVLKDDGILIVSIPNGFGPFEIEKFFTEKTGLLKVTLLSLSLLSKIRRTLIAKKQQPKSPIPYNSECGHVQFFRMRKFTGLLANANFKIVKVKNGSFVGAPFSELFFGRFHWFINWNVKVADRLPYWAVSTWYFVAKKEGVK